MECMVWYVGGEKKGGGGGGCWDIIRLVVIFGNGFARVYIFS